MLGSDIHPGLHSTNLTLDLLHSETLTRDSLSPGPPPPPYTISLPETASPPPRLLPTQTVTLRFTPSPTAAPTTMTTTAVTHADRHSCCLVAYLYRQRECPTVIHHPSHVRSTRADRKYSSRRCLIVRWRCFTHQRIFPPSRPPFPAWVVFRSPIQSGQRNSVLYKCTDAAKQYQFWRNSHLLYGLGVILIARSRSVFKVLKTRNNLGLPIQLKCQHGHRRTAHFHFAKGTFYHFQLYLRPSVCR